MFFFFFNLTCNLSFKKGREKKTASVTSFAQYLYNEGILVLNLYFINQTVRLCLMSRALFSPPAVIVWKK